MDILKTIFDGVRVIANAALIDASDEFTERQLNYFERLISDAESIKTSKQKSGLFEFTYGKQPLGEHAQRELESYEAVNTPGYLIGKFEDMLTNLDLVEAYEKLTSHMEEGRFAHPGSVMASFRAIAKYLPQEDIIDMAELIATDRVFRSSFRGAKQTREDTLIKIAYMAGDAPVEKKLSLFSSLEKNEFLREMLAGASSANVAYLLKNIFEGVDIDSVHMTLSKSKIMDHVIPSKTLRHWLIDQDERLTGALKYAKGVHKQAETGQGHHNAHL